MQYQEEQDYNEKFKVSSWLKILKIAKPLHKYLAFMVLAISVTATIDTIFPLLTGYVIDHFITAGTTVGLGPFAVGYAALVITQASAIFLHILFAGRVEIGVTYYVRKTAFERLQQLSFSFYDKTAVGYLLARMGSDADRLGGTIGWALLDLLWGGVIMIGCLIAMFSVNWQLAILVTLVVPPLAILSIFFQKKILKNYREVRKINSRITGSFNEGIQGAKTTKTLVREEQNFGEFKELTGGMRKASIRAAMISSIYMPLAMSLAAIASALVLWRAGIMKMDMVITFGTLSIFMTYAARFFEPVREIARIFAELQSAQAASERVLSLIETESDVFDSEEIVKVYGDQFAPKKENWPDIHGDVSFEHVSFQYKGGEKVLDDFTLSVKAGETIALVGETGSGKSTIVNLVCRFYEPTEGVLKIDGVDYRERSQLWLQSHLGYVLQAPHLFSGTIRENIRYGRLEATDEEVERAARMVDAEAFILTLEKGYETDVGEGGNRLSTGQKQLVSFARAILADPRIFVLDEATSSIDTETEMTIQQAISTVLEGRTSFIIAHRLSTIREADRILVIQQGKITEQGSHLELLRKRGYYYDLYTNQFREEQEMGLLGKIAGEEA